MQNKANFQKVKLNVNRVLTRNYDQMDTWSIRKTKPIQSQLKPIKANSNPNKANFCTIGSVYCLQLPPSAENLLRNFVYESK